MKDKEDIQTQKKFDIISNMHSQIIGTKLTPLLDDLSLTYALTTCKQWGRLFNNPLVWQQLIDHRFGIYLEITKLNQTLNTNRYTDTIFKPLYIKLRRIKLIMANVPNKLKFACFAPEYQQQLLACCLDDVQYAGMTIEKEEDFQWLIVALAGHCPGVYQFLLHRLITTEKQAELCVKLAIKLKNSDAASYLEEHFKFAVNDKLLRLAIKNNMLQHANYFASQLQTIRPETFHLGLKTKDKFLISQFLKKNISMPNVRLQLQIKRNRIRLDISQQLDNCIRYGCSLDVVTYLIDEFKLKPTEWTHFYALWSDDSKLIDFFQDPKYECSTPDPQELLLAAAEVGDLTLLSRLRKNLKVDLQNEYKNELLKAGVVSGRLLIFKYLHIMFKMAPNTETLLYAIEKNKKHIYEYLLSNHVKFQLEITQEMLNLAIAKKNKALISQLMNDYKILPNLQSLSTAVKAHCRLSFLKQLMTKYAITPDQFILHEAVSNGDLELVKYFLNPKNAFNLAIDDTVFNLAVRSGNNELVYSLIEIYNFQPTTVHLSSLKFCNFELVVYLLMLKPRCVYITDEENLLYLISKIKNIAIHNLLACDFHVKKAVEQLTVSEQSEQAVIHAHAYSPKHFCRVLKDALQNPSDYKLNQSQLARLQIIMNDLLNSEKYVTLNASP